MQDRYKPYFLSYYKLLAHSVVKEFIKSGKFLWVKNRDSAPSIRHWHSKTEILYTLSCTVILLLFFLLYLVFLSKFSVPFCSVFCLSVYFCCITWVFRPWQLLNVFALKELNPFISPALSYRVTDDKHSQGKEQH